MDPVLLDKFLRGEVTEAERREVEQWLEDQPENWLENFMDKGWEAAEPVLAPDERSAAIRQVMNRVRPKLSIVRIARVAAMVAGLLGMTSGAFYFLKNRRAPVVADIAIEAPLRTMKKIILPDSTVIVLNAGSTLKYPEAFTGSTREITLEGEAFFDVAPDPRKPFIIHSGTLNTTVLGTSFNITAYKHLTQLSVTVLTGKVAVTDTLSQQSVTLLPKQKATFNAATAALVTSAADKPENAMAWSEGRLVFEETLLPEVAVKLSNKYNVHITLMDKRLSDYRFNGEFETESLDDILKIISTLTKTSVKREGDTIRLFSKEASHRK
ncbi:FecR family protein [Chitinophaga sp.]|uniref:FecR family protein n=1 Tax=Chitinophaga sp. TaxID=1869181 RepID=UPI002D801C0C|nr:FecR domain-containing protein [Chitinophaga sp.]